MSYSQRYECPKCGDSLLLPEHPTRGPYYVRKGCDCTPGRRLRFEAVGVDKWAAAIQGRT